MIRPLRQRHLITFSVLIFVLPALYLMALKARTQPPVADQLPSIHTVQSALPIIVNDQNYHLNSGELTVRLLADTEPASVLQVEVTTEGSLGAPDILLYWIPTSIEPYNTLPNGAVLLGSLRPGMENRASLPAAALTDMGTILLYSLGHQETLASFPLASSSGEPTQ